MAERCTVEGAVQSLIFQNEDNGYTVLSLLTEDGELVTVVGCIPCAAPGEGMTVTGVWTNHPSYGPQFAAESVERRMPRTEEEIVSYLSSGILKGIGPATAQRLADRFGADTLAVIEEEPERLQTVKGITAKRAMELSAAFRELTGLKRVMEFLARYELPVPLAMQLYRAYGADALPRLREDPYLLTGDAYGVDFSTMDEIALSMGFDGDSPCRVEAALTYELSHNLNNGHVFLPRDKLLSAAAQLISADTDALETALDGLLTRGVIVQEQVANVQACYLLRLYQAETRVARRLLSLRDAPRQTGKNVDRIITEMERQQDIRPALPGGVHGRHGAGLHMPGVAVHHQDADAAQLRQPLRLVRAAIVAVAGHPQQRDLGIQPPQPVRVPGAVPQMEDDLGLHQLHALLHRVHAPVGIG